MAFEHGTNTGYQRGCRCDPCKNRKSTYRRIWRERRTRPYDTPSDDPYGLPQISAPALEAWRDDALCGHLVRSGAADTTWWTDLKGPHLNTARATCRRCPVATDCLAWALRLPEPHGLWGGLIPAERNRL